MFVYIIRVALRLLVYCLQEYLVFEILIGEKLCNFIFFYIDYQVKPLIPLKNLQITYNSH